MFEKSDWVCGVRRRRENELWAPDTGLRAGRPNIVAALSGDENRCLRHGPPGCPHKLQMDHQWIHHPGAPVSGRTKSRRKPSSGSTADFPRTTGNNCRRTWRMPRRGLPSSWGNWLLSGNHGRVSQTEPGGTKDLLRWSDRATQPRAPDGREGSLDFVGPNEPRAGASNKEKQCSREDRD